MVIPRVFERRGSAELSINRTAQFAMTCVCVCVCVCVCACMCVCVCVWCMCMCVCRGCPLVYLSPDAYTNNLIILHNTCPKV